MDTSKPSRFITITVKNNNPQNPSVQTLEIDTEGETFKDFKEKIENGFNREEITAMSWGNKLM